MGLTVDVEIGATIPLGDYTNLRTKIAFNGLDPELPLEPQLEKAVIVAMAAAKKIDEKTEEVIVNTASIAAGKPGVADRLDALEAGLAKRKENEGKIAAKVKELLGTVGALQVPTPDPSAKKTPRARKDQTSGQDASDVLPQVQDPDAPRPAEGGE